MPFSFIGLFRAASLAGLAASTAAAQTVFWNPDSILLNGGGELHKAYNWTAGQNGVGSWAKSVSDDDFTSTGLTGWTWVDATNATATRSVAGGLLTINARGADVWFESNQFAALHKTFPDTFDVSVKVVSQTKADPWSKAGIMVMNDMKNPSAGGCFAVIVTPDNGIKIQYDSASAQAGFEWPEGPGAKPVPQYPVWLRATRKGGRFFGWYRTSATSEWILLRSGVPILTGPTSQAGPFVTSHDLDTASTVVFDDFQGGGDLAPGLDLSFNGTSATADSNARMTANAAAKSVTFTGYTGQFAFRNATLSLTGNGDFSNASFDPGAGTLAFGNGNQTFTPRAGAAHPAIQKTGGGTLAFGTRSLKAGVLTVNGSTVDCGGLNHEFAGLAGSGAILTGLTAADTLAFTGDANFSGFTALPAAGTILIRSLGNAVAQRDVAFTAGAAAFNHLALWPVPAAFPARIAVGGAALNVNGNLTLVDERGAPSAGYADFRPGNTAVTVGGAISGKDNGTGAYTLRLRMGDGKWTAKGNVSLAFPGGLEADASTLELASASAQALTAGTGALNAVTHTGAGTVSLQNGLPLLAASFAQTAGALNLNGSDLNVTGNISIANGGPNSLQGLPGRELRAGGNISFAGTAAAQLNLHPGSAWSVSAGGTLTADRADIGNSSATGSEGSASAESFDKEGNSRWKFTGPAVSRQPNSPTVLAGGKAVITGKASGSGPMVYAWRKRGDATVLSSDTLLQVDAVPSLNGARYYFTAINSAGNVESADGVLTVNEPAGVAAEPADTNVVLGQPASFTAAAKGTGPFKYKWRKAGDTATVDTNAVFAIAKTAASQDGAGWACTISNAYGSAVTRTATLTILFPPRITKHPANLDLPEGNTARFSAAGAGTGVLSYAWFRVGEPDTLGKDTVLTLAASLADNGKKFFCTVRNAYGQENSAAATLTVGQKPGIAAQPSDTTVLAGLPATFKVRATGTGPLSFAWRKVGKADTLGRDSTLVIPPVTWADSGARYICRIANKYGDTSSREAELKVVRPPSMVREPADLVIVAGQPAKFSVSVSGSSPMRFEWSRKGDTAVLSLDSSYTISAASLTDSNSFFQCRISNPYGLIVTRDARLTVVQAALIIREPVSVSAAPGKRAAFSVGAVGAKPMTYVWRRKGDTAAVSRDSVFAIDTVKLKDNGALYSVIVANAFGKDTSAEVKLTVITCDSVFKVFPETLTVDEGQPLSLKGTAACASGRHWSVVSGPAPRILDPEVDSLALTAPRLAADSVTVFRFAAEYANGWVYKNAVVKVREAIPDPRFSLPGPGRWNGSRPYAVRPTLLNQADLKASRYSPAFRYQWFLALDIVDTSQSADSLVLSNPTAQVGLDVTLCMDNGGAVNCVIHTVAIDFASTRLADRAARLGPVSLQGRMLSWNADASARVWGFDGRLLWQGRGRAGGTATLPDGAARDLFRGRARLEILK